MSEAADPEKTCPLCGAANACAVAAGLPVEDCWCWSARLDPAALARIPAEAVGKYCICAACGGVTPGAAGDR